MLFEKSVEAIVIVEAQAVADSSNGKITVTKQGLCLGGHCGGDMLRCRLAGHVSNRSIQVIDMDRKPAGEIQRLTELHRPGRGLDRKLAFQELQKLAGDPCRGIRLPGRSRLDRPFHAFEYQ